METTGQGNTAPLGGEVGEEQDIAARTIDQAGHSDAEGGGGIAEFAEEGDDASDYVLGSVLGFSGDGSLGNQGAVGVSKSSGDLRSAQVYGRVEHRHQDTV